MGAPIGPTKGPDLADIKAEQYRAGFMDARVSVDIAVAPWRNLPDPAAIQRDIDVCAAVVESLWLPANMAAGGVDKSGDGKIAGTMQGIVNSCGKLDGKMIQAFQDRFVFQLTRIVGKYQATGLVLGAALGSELEIWKAGRDSVAMVLDEARQNFDLLAKGPTVPWKATIEIGLKVSHGLEVFLPFAGPAGEVAATTLGTASDVFKIVKDILPADESPLPFQTVNAGLESLGKRLNIVNDQLRWSEEKLSTSLNDTRLNIFSHQDLFDVKAPILKPEPEDYQDGVNAITLNETVVRTLANTRMPALADLLQGVAAAAEQCKLTAPRDERIGIGAIGPNPDWVPLKLLLALMLKDLVWDIRTGAEDLWAAFLDIKTHDDNTKRRLEQINARLEQGNPGSIWNK
jgi:hypothetical protein